MIQYAEMKGDYEKITGIKAGEGSALLSWLIGQGIWKIRHAYKVLEYHRNIVDLHSWFMKNMI